MDRLRPHQIEIVATVKRILAARGSAVDESGTGTGKTYVAAAVAADSGLPTLVIHPKVAYSTWARAAEHFGDKFSQTNYELLRAGNTPFGKWTGGPPKREFFFKCQCCQRVVNLENPEPCFAHPEGIHCIERKSKPHKYGHFVFAPEVKQVIFDEVHRCGGTDSLNAEMLIAAKRQKLQVLALSATIASSPYQMRALGYLLDLHGLGHDVILPSEKGLQLRNIRPNFYRWLSHLGYRKDPVFKGWRWMVGEERQREVMLQLHNLIIPERGVRIRSEDIPGFPACDIQAELYDIDKPEEMNRLYAEVREALELLAARAADDKSPDAPITRILRARQKIELLKVPIAEELGQDYLDKAFSVVFFVNFRQTIDELCKRFPDAPVIDGTPESVRTRDQSVEKFQSNQCSALIVNNEAGGVCLSMQDLDGLHPRVGLVMPNYSAASMRQVFGRLPRDGGKSSVHYRVLFADNTDEMPVHRALRLKLNNLDTLNDADLTPQNLSIH